MNPTVARWILFGACSSFALAGCGAILGIEDFSGGDDGGSRSDTGSSSGSVSSSDSGSGSDGASDGALQHDGSTADAGPCVGSFCACAARDAQFCVDFDEPNALGSFQQITLDAGTITVVDAQSSSPPSSLLSAIQQSSFGAVTFVTHTGATNGATRFDLRFDLQVGTCVPRDDSIAKIRLNSSFEASLHLLDMDGDVIAVGQNSSYSGSLPVTPGTWIPVRLEVDTTSASVEHATVGDASFDYPVPPDAAAPLASVTVELGQSSASSFPCSLYIDNVTFDALP